MACCGDMERCQGEGCDYGPPSLREAAQYALDAITSPDVEYAPGKDIYDQHMMLGAARRLRSALTRHEMQSGEVAP